MIRPHSPLLRRLVLLLLVLCGGAAGASAQIDLPKAGSGGKEQPEESGRRPNRGGDLVPHLVCAVCGEHNYTAARNRPAEDGLYTAWCSLCQRDRLHRASEERAGAGALDLPRRLPPRPVRPAGGAPEAGAGADAGARGGTASAPQDVAQARAASFVLDEVADVDSLGDRLLRKAEESLLGMGAEGLAAARVALFEKRASVVLVAGRVLLAGGQGGDAELLLERLRDRLPGRVGPLLLKELVERDPVHASPRNLLRLIGHQQHATREAAVEAVRAHLGPELLPGLAELLRSDHSQTRLSALQLVAEVEDPAVLDLLLGHIADDSPQVADAAVRAVAALEDPRVALELLSRAFPRRLVLRDNAYALLAIVDREDLRLEPLLDESHAQILLANLGSQDALVHGSCAAALAGIGFRSRASEGAEWLDREVTGRLVDVVSGRRFHRDFSSLQPRALRRLRLITGQSFGAGGPDWATWWIENREGFYARRAWFPIDEAGAEQLEVRYFAPDEARGAFRLCGPGVDVEDEEAAPVLGETFRLTARSCRELVALFEREGVLGPERLPGLRGEPSARQRSIELLVGGRGKRFSFGEDASEPWFERLASAVRSLRAQNRWQRFPDLARYASERDFWEVESGWWSVEHDEVERARRIKTLAAQWVRKQPPSKRAPAIEELERAYALEGVASPADFPLLLELLRGEGFLTARTSRLVGLALDSARAVDGGAPLDADLGGSLIDLLQARFGDEAAEELGRVASACGRDFVRALSRDERPLLRAVAVTRLAEPEERAPAPAEGSQTGALGERDAALLLSLLDDEDQGVQAAAALALGRAHVEAARTELLLRARVAPPRVRAAALRGIGSLGGEYVLDALVLGVADPDPEVKRGAALGLAELRDESSAPLLVSLLGHGPDSPAFEPARVGLLALGRAARGELLRVVRSPLHRARRDAALILAQQLDAEVVKPLIDLLEKSPDDAHVARELTVLTCVDFRGDAEPAKRWAAWWSEVRHDDPVAWLRTALSVRGVPPPPAEAFEGGGTLAAALFLIDVLERPETFLVERARRELERRSGRPLGAAPKDPVAHQEWIAGLREAAGELWDS